MDLITYNSINKSSDDTLLATGMSVAFALGICFAMQGCATQTSQPEEMAAPSTPPRKSSEPSSPPPAPTKPKKKTDDEACVELDSDIIRFIASNPGVTVKQVLKEMNNNYPELTKTEINSRLYTMMHRRILNKIGEKGAPVWFLNKPSSTAIIPK